MLNLQLFSVNLWKSAEVFMRIHYVA
jgi:hypothetical protein